MQRMKKEKEEEEKTGKRRGDIKTEWDHDFRLKLKNELREEVKIECNRQRITIYARRDAKNVIGLSIIN